MGNRRSGGRSSKKDSNGAILHATDETFDELTRAADVPVLVDFSAIWCGPCQALRPVLRKVAAAQEGRLRVVEVDVDTCPQAADRFRVQSIPTLVLMRGGRKVRSTVGLLSRSELEAWLQPRAKG